jgi:hypothetical protein
MPTNTGPITRESMLLSLSHKVSADVFSMDNDALAALLVDEGLTQCLVGRHDGKPVTAGRAFEILTGRRLTLKRAG